MLGDIDAPGTGFGMWQAPSGSAPYDPWRAYLLDVAQRDDDRLCGWRVGCYTLHITLGELQYVAFAGVVRDLDAAVRRADARLEGLDRAAGAGKGWPR